MKHGYLVVCGLVFSTLLLASIAFADRRSYVWTYEYKTVERGEGELESYFTLSTPDAGRLEGTTSVEHQVELEVGMTDRFDFSVYQVFAQAPGEALKYEGFKLRSRYLIGAKGRHAVDPLVYVEYEGKPDFSEHVLESKLVLAKDLGRLNIALNLVGEVEIGDEWEAEPAYAVGASYEIGKLLRAGLEAKGSEAGHYIGPTVSHGREDLWVTIGSAVHMGKVDAGKPELLVRLLLGASL